MMHQHTMFGYKRLSGLEDIWTKSKHMDTQMDTYRHHDSCIPTPLLT